MNEDMVSLGIDFRKGCLDHLEIFADTHEGVIVDADERYRKTFLEYLPIHDTQNKRRIFGIDTSDSSLPKNHFRLELLSADSLLQVRTNARCNYQRKSPTDLADIRYDCYGGRPSGAAWFHFEMPSYKFIVMRDDYSRGYAKYSAQIWRIMQKLRKNITNDLSPQNS